MDVLGFCDLKRVFGWFERGNYEQKSLQIRNFQVNLTRLKLFEVSVPNCIDLPLTIRCRSSALTKEQVNKN